MCYDIQYVYLQRYMQVQMIYDHGYRYRLHIIMGRETGTDIICTLDGY